MSTPTSKSPWMASGSDVMRRAMQTRRIATDVAHLLPILDKLPKGSTVLEVGCGPGGITLDIAEKYPHLNVLGMDIDEDSIKLAKETASKAAVQNIRYAIGDAVELDGLASRPGFEAIKGECDLVYSHAAVMHCSDQLTVVKHMRTAAKLNGIVSLKEGDMGLFFAYPELKGMLRLLEVFPRLGAAKGADGYFGRKLIATAMSAGFSRADITLLPIADKTVSKPNEVKGLAHGFADIFTAISTDKDMMRGAGMTEGDIELIREGLQEWATYDGAIISFPSLVINCVKTAS